MFETFSDSSCVSCAVSETACTKRQSSALVERASQPASSFERCRGRDRPPVAAAKPVRCARHVLASQPLFVQVADAGVRGQPVRGVLDELEGQPPRTLFR